MLLELTEYGITAVPVTEDDWENTGDEVLAVRFDLPYYMNVLPRLYSVAQMPLHWSDWFMVDYLFKGYMPSFTCCSILSYVLWDDPSCDTPRDLLIEVRRRIHRLCSEEKV
jgi:hypothetical protein